MIGGFARAVELWFQTEYAPAHAPWYDGAIWGNLFVVPVAFVLGAVFWPPLRKRIHGFLDGHLSETERMLRHVIEHSPDIPELPPQA